jgi:kinesin family protein 3/17
MSKPSGENVKVMVRTRPMNQKEFDRGCTRVVNNIKKMNQIQLIDPKNEDAPPRTFTFDGIFAEDSKQQELYDDAGFSLVESVLEGYNGTIFAYGQTGCGKTHTMMGVGNFDSPDDPDDLHGVIPKAIRHIFSCIDGAKEGMKFLVRCSYLEIYNEKIKDLLGNQEKKKNPNDEDKSLKVL